MRTKHTAKKLAKQLTAAGVPAVELHGNLSQGARERNLSAFMDGSTRVLVATDIAARGIHVDDVALVVHVDPPTEHKAYLHRSGRTARAGAGGAVVTLATARAGPDVRALAKQAGINPTHRTVRPGDPAIIELAGPAAPYVDAGARRAAPPAAQRAAVRASAAGQPGRGQAGRSPGEPQGAVQASRHAHARGHAVSSTEAREATRAAAVGRRGPAAAAPKGVASRRRPAGPGPHPRRAGRPRRPAAGAASQPDARDSSSHARTPGGPDAVLEAFTAWAPVALYPAQEEALLELLVGEQRRARHPHGQRQVAGRRRRPPRRLSDGRQSVYTAPIKALVSEKFFALCDVFGADKVGMATGDASVNPRGPDPVLHRRGARQPGAAARRRHRHRAGRDGRVPLLRRPRARLGLAGAAARDDQHAVPADVGDPR